MRGLFNTLTPEQQRAALAYRGPEDHGDAESRSRTTMSTNDRVKARERLMLKKAKLAKEAIKAGDYESAAMHCAGAAEHKKIKELIEEGLREDEGEWIGA